MTWGERRELYIAGYQVVIGERLSSDHEVYAAKLLSGLPLSVPVMVKRTNVDLADRKLGAREFNAFSKLSSLKGEERSSSRIVHCIAQSQTDTWNYFLLERHGISASAYARKMLSDGSRREFIETLLVDVYTALSTIRDKEFAHRDLHPANILLPFALADGAVPERVTVIDFSHAYHLNDDDIPTLGSLPGSRVVQPVDILFHDLPHRGFVDDLFSLGMTAHMMLAATLPTAWVFGDSERVYYEPKSDIFRPFLPRQTFSALPSEYVIVPDADRIRNILGDGPAARALTSMLEPDTGARERKLREIENSVNEIRAGRRSRYEDPPTGRPWKESWADAQEDQILPDAADLHGRAITAEEPSMWAPWMAPPSFYAPQVGVAQPSRLRRRRAPLVLPAKIARSVLFPLVLLLPIVVLAASLIVPGFGVLDLVQDRNVQGPGSAVIVGLSALGALVATVATVVLRRSGMRLAPVAVLSCGAALASGFVFLGGPLLGANLFSAVTYSYLPGVPWRISDWSLWQVSSFVVLWGGLIALFIGIGGAALRMLKGRRVLVPVVSGAVLVLACLATWSLVAFPLGTADRALPVDCGATEFSFARGGTDRVCVPGLDGWRAMTEAELAADPFAIAKGYPTLSGSEGSVIALRAARVDCLSAFVRERDDASVDVPDSFPTAISPDEPAVALSRLDSDGKVERARFGGTNYSVYRSDEATNASVAMYLAFSAEPFQDLGSGTLGRFGSTAASVFVVQSGCDPSVATASQVDSSVQELLSSLKVSDTGHLSRSYLAFDAAALAASSLSADSLLIPVGGRIYPDFSPESERIRSDQQAIAAGLVRLGPLEDSARARVTFSASAPPGMESATETYRGWKLESRPSATAPVDDTYYKSFNRQDSALYATVHVTAGVTSSFGAEAAAARDQVLDGVGVEAGL